MNARIAAPRPAGQTIGRAELSDFSSICVGIEEAVQLHDEIAHMGVVDRRMRFRLPGGERGVIVGIDADDVEFRRIAEGDALQVDELAPENEMKRLFRAVAQCSRFAHMTPFETARASARLLRKDGSRRGDQHVAPQLRTIVAQGNALELGQNAARLGEYHIGRGDVPVFRIRGGDGQIIAAGGDVGDAQGERGRAILNGEFMIRAGEAGGEAARRLQPGARQNGAIRDANRRAIERRAMAGGGGEGPFERRGVNDAERRPPARR